MRVTENLITQGFLSRTARVSLGHDPGPAADLVRQEDLAAVRRPAHVLQGAGAARRTCRRIDAFKDNVSSATAFMSMTESSLQEVSDLL